MFKWIYNEAVERLAWASTMLCMAVVGLIYPEALKRMLHEWNDDEFENYREKIKKDKR